MNRMQEYMSFAAKKLGLKIIINYSVFDGENKDFFTAQAFFPDLGGRRGMLVFKSEDKLDSSIREKLIFDGYAISSFSEPLPDEIFDITSYAEMFFEWGHNKKSGETSEIYHK